MITPPYPLRPEPMTKSWIERHPLWKIPLGCLTLIFLLVVYGMFIAAIVTSSFRHSDAYQQAMAIASANPRVREQIGDPIHPHWLISGHLHVNGDTGNANFAIPVSGPRGKGQIRVIAYKNGVWTFTCLQVWIDGQSEKIDLLQNPPAKDPTPER